MRAMLFSALTVDGHAKERMETLRFQTRRPRPHQMETPGSYLTRLCEANLIDLAHMDRLVVSRRRQSGRPDEMAHVIAELGGPDPRHFYQQYVRAVGGGAPLAKAFQRQRHRRLACLRCTAGSEVTAYDHRRFMICFKHQRWIAGSTPADQCQLLDPELLAVERRFRRAMSSGLVTPRLYDGIRRVVIQNSASIFDRLWQGHRLHGPAGRDHHDIRGGLHGRLDLYPAVVRILTITVEYLELYWPITPGKKAMLLHPRPEQRRLYAHLRPRLEWIGSTPESHRVIDGVVAALIAALSLRDIEFLTPRS